MTETQFRSDMTMEQTMPGTYLNMGPGLHAAPAPWINIERIHRDKHPEPQLLWVGNVLPYDDGSVERVYAGHMMEHMPQEEAVEVVREWYRVLQPGGVLTVVGPDVNRALALFQSGQFSRNDLWERMEHGTVYTIERWTEWYRDGMLDSFATHSWNCIPERVIGMLQAAGFVDVKELDPAVLTDWPLTARHNVDQFALQVTR